MTKRTVIDELHGNIGIVGISSMVQKYNIAVMRVAWYTPEAWDRLAAIPEAKIEKTYREFVRSTEALERQCAARGMRTERLVIDVAGLDEMITWCHRHGYEVDTRGRAAHGAARSAGGLNTPLADKNEVDPMSAEFFARWRADPCGFIEGHFYDPETGKPFVLLDAERAFLTHAFKLDEQGRLLYPEQVYSCPKKSGKTGFAALHTLTTILLYGGRFAEGVCCANDLDKLRQPKAGCRLESPSKSGRGVPPQNLGARGAFRRPWGEVLIRGPPGISRLR
jgi:hypothetical protein